MKWTDAEEDAIVKAIHDGLSARVSRTIMISNAAAVLPCRTRVAINKHARRLEAWGFLPGSAQLKWSVAEDEALIAAVRAGIASGAPRRDAYAAILTAMPLRTERSIQARAIMLIITGRLPAAQHRWSAAEDAALVAAVGAAETGATRATAFRSVASALAGRTANAAKLRANKLVAKGRLQALAGRTIQRVAWSSDDDEKLVALLQAGDAGSVKRKSTCAAIAAEIPGRSLVAIKHRIKKLMVAGRLSKKGAAARAEAAAFKLRAHAEDAALVVAAVDDALGSHHETLEVVSVFGSIAVASTAADEDADSPPLAVGSKRNAAAAGHDRSNDAAEPGPKGKRRYW